MASLLNMLNNFLGTSGKPSLFNLDSTNIPQSTDFKSIVGDILNGVKGDTQTLAELMPDQNGGVDLPLLDAAGNALPPQPATATPNMNASIKLPDVELATPFNIANNSANSGELPTLQTGGTTAGDASFVTQSPLTGSLELTPTSGLEASISVSASLATPPSVVAEQSPALQDALASAPAPPNGDAIAGTLDASADAKQLSSSDGALPAQAQALDPIVVPTGATPALATLTKDGKPQLAAVNDVGASFTAPANSSTATPATNTAATPAASVVAQNAAPPMPQPANVDAATLAAKDPQQFALEQALGNEAGSDNDAPVDANRQTLVSPSPTLRAAPTTATPLQSTDPNFANVANMLNQGQSMNSLNDRLQLMLQNGQHSAEIQLDPPELGSLQVKVTTRNEQTQVIFVAANNAVRDALEQQLPRLRETLENAGLQLQDASVFAQTEDKPGTQPQSYSDVEAADYLDDDEMEEAGRNGEERRLSTQLVDAYI